MWDHDLPAMRKIAAEVSLAPRRRHRVELPFKQEYGDLGRFGRHGEPFGNGPLPTGALLLANALVPEQRTPRRCRGLVLRYPGSFLGARNTEPQRPRKAGIVSVRGGPRCRKAPIVSLAQLAKEQREAPRRFCVIQEGAQTFEELSGIQFDRFLPLCESETFRGGDFPQIDPGGDGLAFRSVAANRRSLPAATAACPRRS